MLGIVAAHTATPATTPRARETVTAFPTPDAIAFAAGFARAYLTPQPGPPRAAALRPYLTPELAREAELLVTGTPPAAPLQLTFARVQRRGGREALVTFAVDFRLPRPRRYIAIPIEADPSGRISVTDYPSFTPPPPAEAKLEPRQREPLDPGLRGRIEPMLTRFFRAYLGGTASDLAYFTTPDVRLQPVGGSFGRVDLIDVNALSPQHGDDVDVAVNVRASESRSHVQYLLAYRVHLVKLTRWYVAAVDGIDGSRS